MSLNIIVVLILIGGWFCGRIFKRIGLPSVLGMTLWGAALTIAVPYLISDTAGLTVLISISPFLKSLALIIILLRAGLGIRRETLKKVGLPAMLMAFIPCILEGTVLGLMIHYWAGLPWLSAYTCAFLLAAVSPAVVVPSMLEFKAKKLGKKNDVPTLVLAGASLDDVFAITIFTFFLNLAKGEDVSALQSILAVPVSIIGGILPGIILGLALVFYFNRHQENIRATEKTLLLLGSSILLLQTGNWFHTATLLGIMTVGFILLEKAGKAANELADKLHRAWVFAEIILFVLIGMSVDIKTAVDGGLLGLGIITLGLTARSIGVIIATIPSKLLWREKLFCLISYLPKATVQAAMGTVPLAAGIIGGQLILAYAVLAIIFTAPLGLILIRTLGPRLLSVRKEELE